MTSSRSTEWITAGITAMSILSGMVSSAGDAALAETPPNTATRNPRRDMITALPAPGPHASLCEEARLFDRLVGTWDCNYSFHEEDGTIRRSSGELKFGWIIDGRALQDIWISYPKSGSKDERTIGTSVRFFDSKAKVWRVVFVAPAFSYLVTMEGGAEGSRIVLEGQDTDGSSLRWSFNDIQTDSFTWRGEKSRDGGKTWRLEEEHQMKRRRNALTSLPSCPRRRRSRRTHSCWRGDVAARTRRRLKP